MAIIDLVSQQQRTSLIEQLAGGTPFVTSFGGQGAEPRTRIAQLRGTYGADIGADRLWADALDLLAPVHAQLAPWWPDDARSSEWHPRVGRTDDRADPVRLGADRWSDPAASVPNIVYAQLLECRALATNGLDLGAHPPVAVLGHSQGAVAALAAAGLADDATALAIAHLIGVASTRIARHVGLVADATGSPMRAVAGTTTAILADAVAAFAGGGSGAVEDHVVLGVTNAVDRHVVVGRPEQLDRFQRFAERHARAVAGSARNGSTPLPRWDPLPVVVGFHHPALADAADLAIAWADRCALDLTGTTTSVIANALPTSPTVADLVRLVVLDPFDWPLAVEQALATGAEWIVDLGPDETAARMAQAATRGRGIGICSPIPRDGVSQMLTPGAAPPIEAPFDRYQPGLLELDDGRIVIETSLTRLTGQSPFILAGMTPTTVDAGIVAAAANAGIWAELAGGGQVTAGILHERMAEVAELLDDGVAIHFNTLHLDPYLWGLHLGPNGALLDELRRGAPVRGVTVSAGIPPLEAATELIQTLTDLGVETVTFKPGTVDGIRQVIAIADAVAPRPVVAHIEGGRAGGHHSWEDLDDLLLATYGDLRRRTNLVVCVGGGVGTPAVAATYLDGSWSTGHGRPAMPVDGILIGTAAMACAEATTSPQVKRLLAACHGTDAWIAAGSSDAGVASGRSQLGADIHEIDNAASRTGRLLDEVAGDAEAVDRRRAEIIDALDRTAKPYFGDVADMTYLAVLERFASLCAIGRGGRYEDGRWLDVSWRDRFIALAQRAEARLDEVDHGPIPTRFDDRSSVDDPEAALARLRVDLPRVADTVLHPADVSHFVDVCRAAGKPVPFVPVIDEEVRRWWRSDSLWQAHDDRFDADGVVIIPGPLAVAGIDRVDEPVADLFARFEAEVVAALMERPATSRRVGNRRRSTSETAGVVGVVLSEPAVTWAGRRRRNPALAIAPASQWVIDDDGIGTATSGRARLVACGDIVRLEVDVLTADGGTATAVVDLSVGSDAQRSLVVTAGAADAWSSSLLSVAAGTPAADIRLDPSTAHDHAALFGARSLLPDGLVGSVWPSVFAALGAGAANSPIDGGFMDLVHLDHRIELHRQPSLGAALAVAVDLTGISDTTMGRVAAVTATIDDERGLVATLRERFLVRGLTGSERLDVLGSPGADDGIVPTERRTVATTTLSAPSSAAAMASFTGDHNPLHSSVEIARIAGFASPIVHGMWTSAAMQQAARTATGPTLELSSWQVQFLAPVGYRDEVRIKVVRVGQRDGAMALEITAHAGDVLVAQAHAIVAAARTVYAFPGQGIQRVGMGLDGLARSAAARSVWERADRHTRKRLGFSILHVVRDNPTELSAGGQQFRHPDGVLHLTQFTQVAMATLASAQVAELREAGGLVADAVCCGHSVGEYNALAAITGILELEAVLELVYHRGLAMHRLVPRDADGASRYQMAAARPTEAGLDEAGLLALVDRIADEVGTDAEDPDAEFLQVVNFNLRGRQYAIAGTVPALRRLEDELEELRRRRGGKGVFIRVPGIDVPFHSAVLRDGVPDFRDRLDSILPARIDPTLLVGRYVPNLVPRLFSLDREFVQEIAETVPSTALADVLADWPTWTERPEDLCRVMLLELLAWQFASPVRWIETQDLLFADDACGGVGAQRFVEIGLGSQPTISSLARQTLQLDDAPFVRPVVLNIDVDRASLFGEDVDQPEDDEVDEPAAADANPGPASAPAPVDGPTTLSAAVAASPSATVADLSWTAGDGLRCMLSWWTKIHPDQLGAADSIESLCDGASSRRNQLLMDLGAEFGLGAIEGAAEADLAKLTDEVGTRARTYRSLGPVLRVALDEQLRRVTGPAKGRPTSIADRVQGHWGLGAGWATRVAAHIAAGTRSGSSVRGGDLGWLHPVAPTSPTELDALIDAAVTDLAAHVGVTVAPPAAESGGTLDATAAAALLDTITGPDGVLTDLATTLNRHLGIEPAAATDDPRLSDALRTAAAVDRELGADWIDKVTPRFDAAATLVIDDRWAGQREDLVHLAATPADAVEQRDALQSRLAGGLAEAAAAQAAWWRDHAGDDADLARRLDAVINDVRVPAFAGEVALVTGASPGSIATEVVARLLAGGCTVIATSSRLDGERIAAFRELYHQHATIDAALWLAPANLASNSDVDDLISWITEPQLVGAGGASRLIKPAMTPTLLFPFAAPPVSGDLADVGPRAEIEMRVLLWSLERTIAGLAAARITTGRNDRLHVVLPGSPNRGLFGGDGAYGEAKSAFEALARRSSAEPSWGRAVSIVHAVIGWVRGTGLMAANDRLADTVERAGITTWTATDMADRLVGLCSEQVRSAAAETPVDVDLSGGLLGATIDLRGLAADIGPDDAQSTDADDPRAAATIQALPSPRRAATETSASHAAWPDVDVDPADTVVIVGLGEVGPLGSARTRFEIEVHGELSPGGVAELAWLCGLVTWEQQPKPGFYDAESGELIGEHELVDRYHDRLLAHSGIRVLEDDGRMTDGTVPLLASVYLDRDLSFTVDTEEEAAAFVASDPERTVATAHDDGSWVVTRRAGTEIRVPRRVDLPRGVGAQLPAGFDPTVYGIPADMVESIDRVAIWNLVATVDAFVGAGIEPAELLQWVHPSEVANTQGTGIGGISAIRSMYVDSLLGEPRANDILQEALPNVVAAHVMQSYVGGYGSMIHPVAACATAAVSVEEGYDKIRSGRAAIVVAGGFDDYGPEGLVGFAAMNATASSVDFGRAGVEARRMSRPNDRRRAGFVEGQGGGTIVLARGDIALELGLPVHGVVAWAGSFSDGINTSIPAPGLGLVAAGRGGPASALARHLKELGLGVDDISIISKHDTSTLANDPNESLVHEAIAAALGRSDGNPFLVVSQKSVTGHAKGGAAAFQIAGLCQVLEQGVVPPNRSVDCIDPALAEHTHLVWPTRAVRSHRRLDAGLVTSLGFGHVAAIVAIVHPDAFVASIEPALRADYLERSARRSDIGRRRRLAAAVGGPPLYRRPDRRLGDDHDDERRLELAMLTDTSARLADDGVIRVGASS